MNPIELAGLLAAPTESPVRDALRRLAPGALDALTIEALSATEEAWRRVAVDRVAAFAAGQPGGGRVFHDDRAPDGGGHARRVEPVHRCARQHRGHPGPAAHQHHGDRRADQRGGDGRGGVRRPGAGRRTQPARGN
ncbi:hypothetical protein AB0G55_21885 [Streptomyces toyocaensis]|uniref:hypothetical protein n=1 Tax=Streptomyces toyocaensis TaxID=55952 RepID=UPI0033E0988B